MGHGFADGEKEPGKSAPEGDAARAPADRSSTADRSRILELERELGEVRAELERSERRVGAMKEIGRALGSSLELDQLLDRIVGSTTDLLEADRSTLFLVDSETGDLWSKVIEGEEHHEIRLSPGAGVAGWVARSGRLLLIPNAYEDPRFNRDFDHRSGFRTRDILTCPVKRPQQGATIGVIQVLNKRQGRFDESDGRLLEAIASEIGVALEVSALYGEAIEHTEALERARSELSLLFTTEQAISRSVDLKGTLGTILETASTTMGAKTGAIHLCQEGTRRLETFVARGPGARSLADEYPRYGEDLVGRAVAHNQATYANSLQNVRRGRIRVRSAMAVPILHRDEGVLGAIELLNADTPFSEDDLRTVTMVANQAGRAIASERRRLERGREERLSAIGQMLSGILHDLRTPMTLISGYTEVMCASGEQETRALYAALIDRQIDVLTSMTKDLLAFARGERTLLTRKVFVHVFMDEMTEYIERDLEASGVELVVDVRYRGTTRFDETKLRRVLQNITRNAREAMPKGGHFRIVVEAVEGQLRFVFEDDGPGIPAELENKLFEPFSTSGKAGGTGLGLTMVRQIAKEHGGSVEAEPRAEGGTRFIFSIPLVAATRSRPRRTGSATQARRAGPAAGPVSQRRP